jgi:hypothetical protein
MPAMFGRKRAKKVPQAEIEQVATASPGAYQHYELPTFHGRSRKVIVYTTDANGKVIKTPRK